MKWSKTIAHVAGIRIQVHATFLILVAWVALAAGSAGGSVGAAVSGAAVDMVAGDCRTAAVQGRVPAKLHRAPGRQQRAEPDRDYVLAGDTATLGEIVRLVADLGGVEAPRWRLPQPLAAILVSLTAPLSRLRGWRPPLNREQLRSLAVHWHFDDARARAELGWRPRSLAEGLPPTVEYLRGA